MPRRALVVARTCALLGLGLLVVRSAWAFGGQAGFVLASDVVYNGLLALAAAACAWRARASSGIRRRGWALLAAACAAYLAGDIAFSLLSGVGTIPPIPSIADVGYLAFYPLAWAGLLALSPADPERTSRGTVLDAVAAALAAASFGTVFVLAPSLGDPSASGLEAAILIAYPAGNLVGLALVAGVLGLLGWRPSLRWRWIAVGLLVRVVTDAVFAAQETAGTYVEGGLLDVGWPLSLLLIAHAATLREDRTFAAQPRSSLRVAATPAALAAAVLGLLSLDGIIDVGAGARILCVLTLLAVLARLVLVLHEHAGLLERLRTEALTDALTGLANRRALAEDLPAAMASPHLLALFDLDGFKRYNDSFGHPAGDALLARLGENLAAAIPAGGKAYRMGGDEFCVLVPVGPPGRAAVLASTTAALTEEGRIGVQPTVGVVVVPTEAADPIEALRVADARMYARKARGRGSETRDVLLQALSAREPELHDHAHSVTSLAVRTARVLGLDGEGLDEVARAAELHDVGKVAIPDEILHKPGPLTPEETRYMRQHTVLGERILAAAPALRPVARLVRASHERWDGAGYPDGLAGEAIPLGARIVAVADAYDAITTERPYAAAQSPQEAIDELVRCAGSHFDPSVVAAFLRAHDAGADDDVVQGPALLVPQRPQQVDPERAGDEDALRGDLA